MADKKGRNYVLSVQIDPQSPFYVTIGPPFTCEFDIEKLNHSDGTSASFKLFNLSAATRNQIRFDFNNSGSNVGKRITFFAGYGDQLSRVYDGTITRAWSSRESDNFITYIESNDGVLSLANTQANFNFGKGTSQRKMILALIKALNSQTNGQIVQGYVGNYTTENVRGTTLNGNIVDLLDEISGGGVFFDNGAINVMQDGEYISGANYPVLSSATGLLGTPLLEFSYVRVNMLFEPRIRLYQIINLKSSTGDTFDAFDPSYVSLNTTYRVNGIKHRGTISGAVCGEAITELTLNSDLTALIT